MRVMVFFKSAEGNAEQLANPTPEMLEAFHAMDVFTEELVKAGVFVAAAGLQNGAAARRIVFGGPEPKVIDGPFAESRELVAGFSIWEVKDMDEAVAWARRSPVIPGTPGELELRPFYEPEDLADFITPEELENARNGGTHAGDRGKLGVALSRLEQGDKTMRVMVLVKATEDSESGQLPAAEMLEAMGRFNEELVKAGVMREGDGLKPSSYGARVAFDGPGRTVIDGPFAETRELVAGYWIWEVKDLADAIAWVKRCPNPMPGPSEIEIRPFYEMSDFAEVMTPEAEAIHDRVRGELEGGA